MLEQLQCLQIHKFYFQTDSEFYEVFKNNFDDCEKIVSPVFIE
jgi:hypothetical protein